jgi:tryptophan synthase alpha chain
MNRIDRLFSTKGKNILSVYFTAGYPEIGDTLTIIKELDEAGVDLIEIGMPFSDPVADGPVIQRSSEKSLQNGMSLKLLFDQIEKVREFTDLPLILMGYVNPFYRYGFSNLLTKCRTIGIDGTIIPDLPVEEYLNSYAKLYEDKGVNNIFLVSPQTPEERIRYLDSIARGFLYLVSSSSTTGSISGFSDSRSEYFRKISKMKLHTPGLIGFGISDRDSFEEACNWASGAIIGSAFIKALDKEGGLAKNIGDFVRSIREKV